MISKKYRFKNFDFQKFFKKAKKKENEIFKVWILESKNNHPRFSVIPSKKICSTAVNRNKTRRQIYEILRLSIKKISNIDCVVTTKVQTINIARENLTKKILELVNLY